MCSIISITFVDFYSNIALQTKKMLIFGSNKTAHNIGYH
nr:hypothetical protein [Mucilaginibacter sp. FT3.2]